ncbi:hypothetical protein BU15DRAFT_60194 [Melanogaster broomeanus]|nr:hypothetical protein BU15DRAFT_60194 [Melanogaster broomeanus]
MHRTASQQDEAARQAWREDIAINFSKDQFLFLDESGKDGCTLYRRFGCHGTERGQALEHSSMAALSLDGYVAVRIVDGTIDGAEFYDFMVNEVALAHANEAMPATEDGSIYPASKHSCVGHFLPPSSPNLNPIEQSFSALATLSREMIHTQQERRLPQVLDYMVVYNAGSL